LQQITNQQIVMSMSAFVLLAHLFLIFIYSPSVSSFKVVDHNGKRLPLPSWSIQANNVDVANRRRHFYTTIVDGLGNNNGAGKQPEGVDDDPEKFSSKDQCGISSWDPPPLAGPSNHIHGFQVIIIVEKYFVVF
jgi:hypothetical protein